MGILEKNRKSGGFDLRIWHRIHSVLLCFLLLISMGCSVLSSSKYLLVQPQKLEIYEVKREYWITKNREGFGSLRPPLHALKVKENGELIVFPISTGSLEMFGPALLPIIWAPKWMYATGDPLDKNNVLRVVYSGIFSDIRIETINGISIQPENIGMKKHEEGTLFFLLIPPDTKRVEVLSVEISIKGEKRVLEFKKTRTLSWTPIIVPL